MNFVQVLFDGYCKFNDVDKKNMLANCTCTLIKSQNENIIVDTMTAWDGNKIIEKLKDHDLTPNDITTVINTHGHSDHIGNNNLFLKAKHIVGQSVSIKDLYIYHDFSAQPYVINDSIQVIATSGHTLTCISVIVKNTNIGNVIAIVGDLFESANDIDDMEIWLNAGSENSILQKKNRLHVADLADVIIPGHGPKFIVTKEIRDKLRKDVELS